MKEEIPFMSSGVLYEHRGCIEEHATPMYFSGYPGVSRELSYCNYYIFKNSSCFVPHIGHTSGEFPSMVNPQTGQT